MTTNEFVELQMVILAASCALMLAVYSVESGGLLMRAIIFSAAFLNVVASLIFIGKERNRIRNQNTTKVEMPQN
jgi:hypothetical protein